MRRCSAVLAAAAALLAAGPLGAEEGRAVRLAYTRRTGAEACPDDDGMRRAISGALGHAAFSDDAPIRISIAVARAGTGFAADVTAQGDVPGLPATRRLAAPTCEQLTALVATVLGVLLDPDPQGPEQPPPASPPPAAPPPAAPPPPIEPPPELPAPLEVPRPEPPPPPEPPSGTQLETGLAVHLAVGSGPSAAPGVDVHAGVRRGIASLALEGRWDAPIPVSPAAAAGLEVRAWMLAATLAPCVHVRFLVGCGLASIGTLDVGATAPGGTSDHAARLYAALGLRAGAEAHLAGPLSGRLTADLVVPLGRAEYQIPVPGSVPFTWTPAVVSGVFGAGLVARWF